MQAGARIGRYEVVRELGVGGAGAVYEAIDQDLRRHVALKVLLAPEERGAERRFELEVQALSSLAHPNIVRMFEVFQAGGRTFAAMELLAGGSLQDRLQRGGPLPVREAATLMRDVARALAYVHERGILHRDLKPANILVDEQGRPRVSDFGLALAADRERLTLTGELVGTPSFMAPEQMSGDRGAVGPATDVYALGATLFALLTGGPPFAGHSLVNVLTAVAMTPAPPPSSRRSEVDASLDELCLRCLEKDPKARFTSAAALAGALDAYLVGSPRSRARRPRRSRRLVAGALAGVGLVVVTAAVVARIGRPAEPAAIPVPVSTVTEPTVAAPTVAPQPTTPTPAPVRLWRQREGLLTPRFGLEGGLAWDEDRGALLCYGGYSTEVLSDFWAWNGETWSCLGVNRFALGERYSFGFVGDPGRRRPIAFGGMSPRSGSGRRLADDGVWEWDGAEWTRRPVATGDEPGARHWLNVAAARERGTVLLFGGRRNQTNDEPDLWEWDGKSARWTRHVLDPAPAPRNCAGLAWDSRRKVLVLFGGSVNAAAAGDTWEWDGAAWHERRVEGPPARFGHGMVFDGSRVVVFGGLGAAKEALGDTWTWDGTRWEPLELQPRPPARHRHGMGWDPRRKVVVVVAGRGDGGDLSDVWELGPE